MFVSDVSDFKFVGKVKPAFFIAKEEVFFFSKLEKANRIEIPAFVKAICDDCFQLIKY